jgi:flagellar motility protein MotE (MotC chaperone)
MMQIIQAPWMAALIGGVLYLATTVALLKPGHIGTVVQAKEIVRSPSNDPSWKFRNPEFDQWLAEIKEEKEALALKEQQLTELQARLDAQLKEISIVTQAVHQVQADFDKNVIRFKGQEAENVKRQAKLISAMSPESAAALFAEMQDDDVVRLLFVMKNDEAALILETMSKTGPSGPKRAAALTERLRKTLPPTTGGSRATTAS